MCWVNPSRASATNHAAMVSYHLSNKFDGDIGIDGLDFSIFDASISILCILSEYGALLCWIAYLY